MRWRKMGTPWRPPCVTQLANKHSAALDVCKEEMPLVQVYQQGCLKLWTWSHFNVIFIQFRQLEKPDVKNTSIFSTKFNQYTEPWATFERDVYTRFSFHLENRANVINHYKHFRYCSRASSHQWPPFISNSFQAAANRECMRTTVGGVTYSIHATNAKGSCTCSVYRHVGGCPPINGLWTVSSFYIDGCVQQYKLYSILLSCSAFFGYSNETFSARATCGIFCFLHHEKWWRSTVTDSSTSCSSN